MCWVSEKATAPPRRQRTPSTTRRPTDDRVRRCARSVMVAIMQLEPSGDRAVGGAEHRRAGAACLDRGRPPAKRTPCVHASGGTVVGRGPWHDAGPLTRTPAIPSASPAILVLRPSTPADAGRRAFLPCSPLRTSRLPLAVAPCSTAR